MLRVDVGDTVGLSYRVFLKYEAGFGDLEIGWRYLISLIICRYPEVVTPAQSFYRTLRKNTILFTYDQGGTTYGQESHCVRSTQKLCEYGTRSTKSHINTDRCAASFFTMVSSSNAVSDDDSALDESEQLNLPLDVALRQQRIQAWHPVLDPVWVIFALFYLGVIFVPTGTYRIHL
jgi:hypothetical protein